MSVVKDMFPISWLIVQKHLQGLIYSIANILPEFKIFRTSLFDRNSNLPLHFPVKVFANGSASSAVFSKTNLSSEPGGCAEFILDYGACVGGRPVFTVEDVVSNGRVELDIIYSESRVGVDHEQGDGPFFLFSNAMNTYRRETHTILPISQKQIIRSRYTQDSQRYQKLILKSPNSRITLSDIGFEPSKPKKTPAVSFSCSDKLLNKIWKDGVRTVEMCTLSAGEVPEAWEVTEEGTRVFGQHWAPCRRGTHWDDKIVSFEVLVEEKGASWGIHMVANGLIFCLDVDKRTVQVFEGLSHTSSVFPSIEKALWLLPDEIQLDGWLTVDLNTVADAVELKIGGFEIGRLDGLKISSICGGALNTGSIAFGGPPGYQSLYRNLLVCKGTDILYDNNLLLEDKVRTLGDFAVGTNALACTLDGAKRDRAVFAGDLFVIGRSIFHSTMDLEAVRGSLQLLASNQSKEGYLGNLCPVQAPVHKSKEEPPTDAFYSLSYSLLLLVSAKDYWLYSGDELLIRQLWPRFEKLLQFTQKFVDKRGLVVAPPPLSMDWFPLGGPVFGASSKINLAYYEALMSIATMSIALGLPDHYTLPAKELKSNIIQYLYDDRKGIMRMSDSSPSDGVCQDVFAYAVKTEVAPAPSYSQSSTSGGNSNTGSLPLAFVDIPGWDKIKIVSPYASGFDAESKFHIGDGQGAVELIKRVWGAMADTTSPDYSGAHWEAMKPDGTPFGHDTSLSHGWSSWPTFLLPKYLGGIEPLEAGWKRWSVQPLLANLTEVNVEMDSVAGKLSVCLNLKEGEGKGDLVVLVPKGTVCEVRPPKGWMIEDRDDLQKTISMLEIKGNDTHIRVPIVRSNSF